MNRPLLHAMLFALALTTEAFAQHPPYADPPPAAPPYFRVRFEGSDQPGKLAFPVQFTIWIPEGVKALRGVVVHQHGCGEGSCKSGQTGAFDLHWQALARKHDCALLSPAYEQPQKADCQLWCDPRNGSSEAFLKALGELGRQSGHPELATVPWALWGHSGGGHWAGGMTFLHPERVAASWLRSGVPFLEANPDRPDIKPHAIPPAALAIPIMCNPGTKEGVTVKEGRFARVWPANEQFFKAVRSKGGLIGVAVDPLSSHECGNQRYLAIPWLDACLSARLPKRAGDPLRAMPTDEAWLAPLLGKQAVPASEFDQPITSAVWLPDAAIAQKWMSYVSDTEVPDDTPPPAPSGVRSDGNELTWKARADVESGLSHFIIYRDGKEIATVPENPKNRFGRPVFQGLQYSDTPATPLVQMRYVDTDTSAGVTHRYQVRSVNTRGQSSALSD